MSNPSDTQSNWPPEPKTLDEALEQCILLLESGEAIDREQIVARFPAWSQEIGEFLDNWQDMASLVSSLDVVDTASESTNQSGDLKSFGDYEIFEQIGRGGMGTIYRARQKSLDRIVAIKMVHSYHSDHERFRIEAESIAALTHANIVPIYEIGEHEGRPFFSMQFIDGGNLKEHIDELPMDPKAAAQIARTTAQAVHYAHQHGILHRDLKPANILIDQNRQPHVTDFGLAKRMESEHELTQTGMIVGTPGYMSPEQASGSSRSMTTAADVYGLGAILYAMLTGEAPFVGDSSWQIIRRVIDEPPVPPRRHNSEIDRDLETICLKCLEKEPGDRYESCETLARDLKRYLNNEPVAARPISDSERFWRWCQRNPAIACLSAAVVMLLLATTLSTIFLAIAEQRKKSLSEQQTQLIDDVSKAKRGEKYATALANRKQAELFTAKGLFEAKNDNVGEALLWFCEAGSLLQDSPKQSRLNLVRSQSWLSRQPTIAGAILLDEPYNDSDRDFHTDAQFCQSGSHVVLRNRSKWYLWCHGQNAAWRLTDDYPDILCATWSNEQDLLAIGTASGSVILIDPKTRDVQKRFSVDYPVNTLKYSNRDSLLLIATGTKIQLWKPETGQLVDDQTLESPSGRWIHLDFDSKDRKLIAVMSARKHKGKVFVFSLDDDLQFRELFSSPCHYRRLRDYHRPVWPVFVNNEKLLLVRNSDHDFGLLDLETGTVVHSATSNSAMYSMAASPTGFHLAIGIDQHVRVEKIADDGSFVDAPFEKETSFRLAHSDRVLSCDISPQGIVATGSWDCDVKLWQVAGLTESRKEEAGDASLFATLPHQTRVRTIDFSPDGSQLITVQMDGLVRLWQIPQDHRNGYSIQIGRGGTLVKQADSSRWLTSGMTRWTGRVSNATFYRNENGQPDGGTQISQNDNSKLGHFLDSDFCPMIGRLATVHASFGRQGASFGRTDGTAGSLMIWDDKGNQLAEKIPMPSEPRSVVFSKDGKRVFVCTCRTELVVVDVAEWKIEATLIPRDQNGQILFPPIMMPDRYRNEQLAVSPDGQSVAVWGNRFGLWVWDIEGQSLKFPRIQESTWPVLSAEFSPDGSLIAYSHGRVPLVRVVDAQSGQQVGETMEHASMVHSARFSPDGKLLVTACRDGQARVYNWKTGELVHDELWHDSDVVDATYSPDGRFILTLGNDKFLRIWNAESGQLAIRPEQTLTGSSQIHVTPDSRYAVIGGGMEKVLVFELSELYDKPTGIDLARLRSVSELLANQKIDSGVPRSIGTRHWIEKWDEFFRKRSELH